MESIPAYPGTALLEGGISLLAANAIPTKSALTIGQLSSVTSNHFSTNGYALSLYYLTIYGQNASNVVDVGTGTLTVSRGITVAGNSTGVAITAGSGGTLSLNDVVDFNISGSLPSPNELTINAVISGGSTYGGTIQLHATPVGSGIPSAGMILAAPVPNTYTLGTMVYGGTLTVMPTTTLGAGTSPLTLSTSTVDSTVIINSAQSIGTLSTGDLSTKKATVNLNGPTVALTINQLFDDDYAGVIIGSGSIYKQGTGTLILSGVNTYTGGTTVVKGALSQNGSKSPCVIARYP
jgi:autotransporter-associated beta strand protein